ncbi:MAG: stage II sporulation protein P [Clostridium sp.]|nr:stage II sporulation protein P [Clostridium sp.]
MREISIQTGRSKRAKVCLIVLLLLLFLLAVSNIVHSTAGERTAASDGERRAGIGTAFLENMRDRVYRSIVPIYAFADEKHLPENVWQAFFDTICGEMPILSQVGAYGEARSTESRSIYEELIAWEIERERSMLAENPSVEDGEDEQKEQKETDFLPPAAVNPADTQLVDELVLSENQAYAQGAAQGDVAETMSGSFALRTAPSFTYDWTQYQELEELVKGFYIVDPTTTATTERLNIAELTGADMTLKGDASSPQILIYHTHSLEAYADSAEGDLSTGVVGAGEYLAQLLRTQYGFNVIHHTGQYDVENRDRAYSCAEPAIRQILAENPTIEVVIDLHRDAVKEDVRLVADIDGRPTAKFMFFNGLSYNNTQGNIEYLYNPYIKDNLAFSFQAQALANEYYPGVTRGIYLRALRYNMHFCPKSMLIELGAQTNTCEEIWNAVPIIAQILGMELSGTR